jgi:hypothetical protein
MLAGTMPAGLPHYPRSSRANRQAASSQWRRCHTRGTALDFASAQGSVRYSQDGGPQAARSRPYFLELTLSIWNWIPVLIVELSPAHWNVLWIILSVANHLVNHHLSALVSVSTEARIRARRRHAVPLLSRERMPARKLEGIFGAER